MPEESQRQHTGRCERGRGLILGEVVERLECSQRAKASVSLCGAADNFLSNTAAPHRQRTDSLPELECEVCDFLATKTSGGSHQGVSLISTSRRYFSLQDCLCFFLFVEAGSLCCDRAALKKMFMEVWFIKPTAFIRPVGTF